MAVQKKTAKEKTTTKKPINWTQVCIIGFVVLIVVMCVLSFSNFTNFFSDKTGTSSTDSGITLDPSTIQYSVNQSTLSDSLSAAESELEKQTTVKKTVSAGDNLDVVMITYKGDKPTSYTKTTVIAGNEYTTGTQGTGMGSSGNAEINSVELTNIAKDVVGKSTNTMLECNGSGTTGENDSITMTKSEFQNTFGISDDEYAKYTVGTTVMAPGSFMTVTMSGDNQYTLSQVNRGGIITNVSDESITYNTGSEKIRYFVTPSVTTTTTENTTTDTSSSTEKTTQ